MQIYVRVSFSPLFFPPYSYFFSSFSATSHPFASIPMFPIFVHLHLISWYHAPFHLNLNYVIHSSYNDNDYLISFLPCYLSTVYFFLFLIFSYFRRQAQPLGRWIELARLSLIRREYAFMYSKLLRRSNDTGNFVFNVNAKVDSAVLTKLFRYEMILPIRAVVRSLVRWIILLSIIYLFIYLSNYLSVYLSIYLFIYQSICLSINLFVYLFKRHKVILAVYMSLRNLFSSCLPVLSLIVLALTSICSDPSIVYLFSSFFVPYI